MNGHGRSAIGPLFLVALLLWGAAAGGAPADGARSGAADGAGGTSGASDGTQSKTGAPNSTASAGGAADSTQDKTGAPDSAQAKADTAAVDPFVPTSSSRVSAGEADMSIGSSFDLLTNTADGWSIRNSIMMEKRVYRGLDMPELTESITNHAQKNVPDLYVFGLSFGEDYSKRRSLGLGRLYQFIVNDNQSAGLDFTLTKPILGAALTRVAFSAAGRRGQNDFKYDRSLNGAMSSTLHYLFKDVVKVGGGYGTARRRVSSDVGKRSFGAMPSSSDTVRALMDLGGGTGPKLLRVDYKRSAGEERRITPPRGNFFEILDDPSKAKQERIKTRSERLAVNSTLAPLPFLSMGIQLSHSVDGQTYAVDTALTKRSRYDNIAASMSYQYAARGGITVDMTAGKKLDDFGPASLASARERFHELRGSLSQKIGDSLSISMTGAGSLNQRFYLKSDVNPRDADILQYRGDIGFRTGFERVSAGVRLQTSRFETINIDSSVSADNRVDFQYTVVPQFTVKPTNWLRIAQEYIIKIDYTDFTYTGDKNYLNRTTQLGTRADFAISTPLRFTFRHAYYMKDTGGYRTNGSGKRIYTRTNDNREHNLNLNVRYDPIPEAFGLRASADFKIQRTNNLRYRGDRIYIASTTIFESGGLMVGFTRNKKIGSMGEVNIDIAYNRRYGPSFTAERREFWDVNSEIVLGF